MDRKWSCGSNKQKIYFSGIEEKFTTPNYFRVLLIPNKWWKISEWKLGISLISSGHCSILIKEK